MTAAMMEIDHMQPSSAQEPQQLSFHTPPAGRGPGILLIAKHRSKVTEERARLLAEEGYVVLATDAGDQAKLETDLDRLENHPARLGKLGVVRRCSHACRKWANWRTRTL
jgi:hypothetical protein